MHFFAHAGVGWAVGTLAPGTDRRLRAWCFTTAVLPDIDTVTFLLGKEIYEVWHHTFGHNVFLGVLCVGAAAWFHRKVSWKRALLASGLVALCFGSHLVADMKLSNYAVELFWPFSRTGYEFEPNLSLGAPINTWLVYAGLAAIVPLAFLRKVTPLDFISPRLDRLVLNNFRRKSLACSTCGRRCNNACDACGTPTCMRHGRVRRGFRISCPSH